jgi:beta-N-acetylhexosaminidase
VICAVYSQVRAYKGGAVLSEGLANIVRKIAAAQKRHCVVSFGSPYHIMQFPEATCFVCAYSPCDASQAAAAEAITGRIPFAGRLPVSIPGMFERGHGIVLKSQRP